jgi:putative transposase
MPDNQPHRKHIKHFDGEGCARSLTFSCHQRRPFLSRDRTCEWMMDAISRGRERHAVHLWAFVIMPEHVHLLIWPTDLDFKVEAFLTTVKQSVSKRARTHLIRTSVMPAQDSFHFWQDGPGYDRNLWHAQSVWETIDYIHLNPVRRDLCERAS